MDLFGHPQENSAHGNRAQVDCEHVDPVDATKSVRRKLIDTYNNFDPGVPASDFDFRRSALEFVEMIRRNSKSSIDPLKNKGFLSVMITVTKKASFMEYPLIADQFFANSDGSGQVKDLTRTNEIAREWRLAEKFPKDGGRNNNGSMGQCRSWVAELNRLARHHGRVAHGDLLDFWISQAEVLFSEAPVTVKYNPKSHVREFLDSIVGKFKSREREWGGAKLLGTMMQHMVGTRLMLQLGEDLVEHHPVNQSDLQTGRNGDFTISDSVFHVTSAPTEALIAKCRANRDEHLRPIIVTLSENTSAARTLAGNASLDSEVEVIDFESYITTGILDATLAGGSRYIDTVRLFVETYNDLVENYESSNVIKIKFAK